MAIKLSNTEDRGGMLVIFKEMAEGLNRLDADERHKIVDSVLDWYAGGTGEAEGLSPTAQLLVRVICDKQMAYAAVCQKRQYARRQRRGRSRVSDCVVTNSDCVRTKPNSMSTSTSMSTSMSISTSNSESAHIGCVRPTLEEVVDYCKERGSKVDAQAWYDYYTANGWKVGKNPMKDWQAAVRTWERNGVGAAKAKAVRGDNFIGATEEQRKEFSDGFGR